LTFRSEGFTVTAHQRTGFCAFILRHREISLSNDLVGVVGGGLMGSGIARACALAGSDVILCELDDDAAAVTRTKAGRSLERAVARGLLSGAARDRALARLTFTADLDSLADRTFVIEAIVEDEATKRDLFARLDKIVAWPSAALATNTSSIPVTRLASATSRPERVVGMHFFNPVPSMKLVEVVSTPRTDPAIADRVASYASAVLGKNVVRCADRAGFVVNALLTPYLLSAVRMLESGFASAEDIDRGMVDGCGYPVGPLALADFVGLDTLLAASTSMYQELLDPAYAPPPLLRRMVESGLVGAKSGRGFYEHAQA
jgi:3-hydroxybutyryl-CoA dehydrogenase